MTHRTLSLPACTAAALLLMQLVAVPKAAWSAEGAPSAWTTPVEVFHDDKRCIAYRALFTGEHLLVEMTIEEGWHTFSMDNERRQADMLKGKPSLGIEKPTGIKVTEGLQVAGPWFQTPPKDFSKPEIRWYTYGYDSKALFAVKAARAAAGTAKVNVRAQACTDSVCKNVDITIPVPVAAAAGSEAAPIDWKSLVEVRP
jgi:hypothetical protein